MYRIPGVATTPARDAPRVRPTRGPPAAPGDSGATGPAGAIAGQAEEHERIWVGLNDVVARRLSTACVDLQAALGLMGDHPANSKIGHALGELDQAIRDIQDTVIGQRAG
jgi:hypothetical protein